MAYSVWTIYNSLTSAGEWNLLQVLTQVVVLRAVPRPVERVVVDTVLSVTLREPHVDGLQHKEVVRLTLLGFHQVVLVHHAQLLPVEVVCDGPDDVVQVVVRAAYPGEQLVLVLVVEGVHHGARGDHGDVPVRGEPGDGGHGVVTGRPEKHVSRLVHVHIYGEEGAQDVWTLGVGGIQDEIMVR